MREFIQPNATRDDLRAIVADPTNSAVEFLERPSAALLSAVDEEVFAKRPDIGLSLSDRYGRSLELSILNGLPSLRRLKLSSAGDPPDDLHRVCAIPGLTSLYLGEFGLTSYDFLSELPVSLEDLGLSEPPRGKRSVAFLARLTNLRALSVTGPVADLEVVGNLVHLTRLNLKSVSPTSLHFLAPLRDLRALRLALGGVRSLQGLEALDCLQYLEIWQVRNLSDLQPIAHLTALETLFLQALRNVKTLPSLARLTELKRVWLDTMKGLRDFRGIAQAPNLREFTFIAALNCEPDDFEPLLNHPTLETMRVGFGSRRTNEKFEVIMAAAGKRHPGDSAPGDPVASPHN
jgi:hypothetical protein